jgi:protein-disulfide isomerase
MPKKRDTEGIVSGNSNALVIILVILAFFTGYLFFKVQNLEKGKTDQVAKQEDANEQQPQEPELKLDVISKVDKNDHIRGNLNTDIILVEYSDYECPFCKDFHATLQQLMKDYGNKIAWVYRHYPLSFHPKAQKSAEAAECVAELGGNDAFWKFSDQLFEKMPDIELSGLPALASSVGINEAKFKNCLDSGKYKDKVNKQLSEGQDAGIQGTPGTVIITKDGKRDLIGGALPVDQVKTQIDALLK